MSRSAESLHGVPAVDLDAVANAITPELLQPYVAPQRPITLGGAATHYMRATYNTGVATNPSSCTRTNIDWLSAELEARRGVSALAQSIANALGTKVISDIDWTLLDGVQLDSGALRDTVVVCADALSDVADPTAMLTALAEIQRQAAVLVISVPLREFTMTIDDVGPPTRPGRVREWAFPEAQALLDAAGLDAVFGGLVPETAANVAGQTAVFVAVRGVSTG